MKANGETQTESKPLTRRQIRSLERKLGVIIDTPDKVSRSAEQQFGIYDEDEKHVGDIRAADFFFTEEELRAKILKLFGKDKTDSAYLTFGELKVCDRFIFLPSPGDNSGHGGFKQPHYIFAKAKDLKGGNAYREKDYISSRMSDSMPVIKVE